MAGFTAVSQDSPCISLLSSYPFSAFLSLLLYSTSHGLSFIYSQVTALSPAATPHLHTCTLAARMLSKILFRVTPVCANPHIQAVSTHIQIPGPRRPVSTMFAAQSSPRGRHVRTLRTFCNTSSTLPNTSLSCLVGINKFVAMQN